METLKTVIEVLNSLSPLGLAGLLGFIIWKLVQSGRSLDAVKENHLHPLPEMVATLERIEKLMQTMNDNIIYIKARVNGKSE